MKNTYKVYYTIATHARYGTYCYNHTDKFEAESKAEAEQLLRADIKENPPFKRFNLLIRAIKQINPERT